jgi:hypothetical protein
MNSLEYGVTEINVGTEEEQCKTNPVWKKIKKTFEHFGKCAEFFG